MQRKGNYCSYLNPLPDNVSILSQILSIIKKITNHLQIFFSRCDQFEYQLPLSQIKLYIDQCRQLIQKIQKTQDSQCQKLLQRFFSRIIEIITIKKHRYIQQSFDSRLISYCKEQQAILYQFYRGVAPQFIIQKFLAITNKYIIISNVTDKVEDKFNWSIAKNITKQANKRKSNIVSKSENIVKKIVSNINKNRQIFNCLDLDQGHFKQSCLQAKTQNCELYEDWISRNKGINKNIHSYQKDYNQYLKKKQLKHFFQSQKVGKITSELKNNINKNTPTGNKRRNFSVILAQTVKAREGFYSDKKFQLRANNSEIRQTSQNQEVDEYIFHQQSEIKPNIFKESKQISYLNHIFPQLDIPKWKNNFPMNKVVINGNSVDLGCRKITNRRLLNIKQKQEFSFGLKSIGNRKLSNKKKSQVII